MHMEPYPYEAVYDSGGSVVEQKGERRPSADAATGRRYPRHQWNRRKRRPSLWSEPSSYASSGISIKRMRRSSGPYSRSSSQRRGSHQQRRSPFHEPAAIAAIEPCLRSLAEQLPSPFIALDRQGRISVWSSECVRLTGWTAAEVRADLGCLFPEPGYRAQLMSEWAEHCHEPAYHEWEWRVTCRDGSQRTIMWTSCNVFSPICPWSDWAIGHDVTDEVKSRELLREMAQGFAATSADDFFQQLVVHLVAGSGLDHAIVGEYARNSTSVRTIAACVDGKLVPNLEYCLVGTPCEEVIGYRETKACIIPSNVRELFPEDCLLREMGVEGYVGQPLFSSEGKVIGLMVLMSRTPIRDAEQAQMVLNIFGSRASAEFERRQHEMAMQKCDLLFRQVTDNISSAVYVATPDLREFFLISQAFETIWGASPSQLLKQPKLWLEGIEPDERDRVLECRSLDTYSLEFRVTNLRTREVRWVRDRGWKIWPEDGCPRVVGVIEDISLERQTLENLDRARQMAEEASTAKTLFLANISHEIRTPLQGIQGTLELLEATQLNPSQRENLLIAKRSADHMLFLVNDLLDVVRIERGKLDICPASFALRDYLDFLSSSFTRSAVARKLNFTSSISAELPDVVVGDKDRMAQILNNIVGNAFKFTAPGGNVSLGVRYVTAQELNETLAPHPTATVANPSFCWPSGNVVNVLFTVSDSGIGIPRDKLPHIFDAFYQVDPAHTKKYTGLGMGLKISYELVSMMHGQIWVDSIPGSGTTFFVLIPFAKPRLEAERDGARSEADGPGDIAHKKLDILLVEDNVVNQKVICRLLAQKDCQFQVANNGAEAVEKFKSPHQFDAILMDVQMPVMDGLTATIKIRELENENAEGPVPIIGLTAAAMKEDKEKCLAAGMDDYLSKPVSRESLLAALYRWTQPNRRDRRNEAEISDENHTNVPTGGLRVDQIASQPPEAQEPGLVDLPKEQINK